MAQHIHAHISFIRVIHSLKMWNCWGGESPSGTHGHWKMILCHSMNKLPYQIIGLLKPVLPTMWISRVSGPFISHIIQSLFGWKCQDWTWDKCSTTGLQLIHADSWKFRKLCFERLMAITYNGYHLCFLTVPEDMSYFTCLYCQQVSRSIMPVSVDITTTCLLSSSCLTSMEVSILC